MGQFKDNRQFIRAVTPMVASGNHRNSF